MHPLFKLAVRYRKWKLAKRLSRAESAHEQTLWWAIHLFIWRWWLIRRQQNAFGYYPDISISGVNLCIEVDGPFHLEPDRAASDAERTTRLEKNGWTVIRFRTTEIERSPITAALHVRGMVLGLRKGTRS